VGDALKLTATDSVNIVSTQEQHLLDTAKTRSSSSFFKSKTTQQADYVASSRAIGSSLSGKTVEISAGKDINVLGSAVAGEGDVSLAAVGGVNIAASTSTLTEQHHTQVKESGFLSGGGFGFSIGTRTTTTDQGRDATTQSGQSRSMVGSLGGNLDIVAGEAIKVSGSDLAAAMNMNLMGRSVTIDPGQDNLKGKFEQTQVQDGLTLAIGGSAVNAVQTVQGMSSAASQSKDSRVQALAAAAAALAVKDAAADMAKNGLNVNVSLTVGHSESKYTETTSSLLNSGSVLNAGNDITIRASGAGKDSNVSVIGSDLNAKGNITLKADNQVNLLAAQDQESQRSNTQSMSAAVGIGASISTKGTSIGLTASASASRGNVDGDGATQVNSHVNAGDRLTITSGGDTNLKGAVASGGEVVVDVKGNLNIESLQDRATLDGKRQSASVSGTLGGPSAGLSASASQSKVHNDFASVQEQSGIRAGDGGFQVQVAGNTDLKGGVISSSEQAIKDGRNSVATGTLTFSDIQNRDTHDASGVSLGVNVGKNQNGSTFSPSLAPGIGQVSGSQGSVTRSGVSGGALIVADEQAGKPVSNLNRDVTTGKDTAGALGKAWTGAQALDEVGAQMQITSAAMPRLAKEIGDYAARKVQELKDNPEEAAKWAEGGIYRVAAHAALGAMDGGLYGAAGAVAAAEAAPTLNKLQAAMQEKLASAGLSNAAADVAARLIAGGAAGAIGGVVGGGAAAATALNADMNNRQLHPDEKARIKQLAGGDPSAEVRLTAAACAMVKCYAEYPEDSPAYKQLKQLADIGASNAFAGERAQLSSQPGMFGYSATGIFSDANFDAAKKLNNTYQIGTRLVGTGKLALGTGGVIVSAFTAPALCATGFGCFANWAAGTVSLDAAYSGGKQLVSGTPTETYLNQGLQSLGMSPKAAAWVEAGLGIGAATTAWSVANKTVDQAIALSKLSAASYKNFVTDGVQANQQLMHMPVAQALKNEIQAGNPNLPQSAVERFAKEYIESGSNLPQVGIAAPGTILLKIVPKGDSVSPYTGYWMSPQQARAISTMAPEQVGELLGLPAAQAANILKNGMDVYAIMPKAGATPNVFVSNVARTTQGAVTMPGGAQQVIVPNRSLWTTPKPVNLMTLRPTGGN
jgi:filamentous hemagglutinin